MDSGDNSESHTRCTEHISYLEDLSEYYTQKSEDNLELFYREQQRANQLENLIHDRETHINTLEAQLIATQGTLHEREQQLDAALFQLATTQLDHEIELGIIRDRALNMWGRAMDLFGVIPGLVEGPAVAPGPEEKPWEEPTEILVGVEDYLQDLEVDDEGIIIIDP